MKRLFNEYEAMNDAGNRLSDDVLALLRPLIDVYEAEGYSLRDIDEVICSVVGVELSSRVLKKAVKKKKEDREKRSGNALNFKDESF